MNWYMGWYFNYIVINMKLGQIYFCHGNGKIHRYNNGIRFQQID